MSIWKWVTPEGNYESSSAIVNFNCGQYMASPVIEFNSREKKTEKMQICERESSSCDFKTDSPYIIW